MTRPTPAPATSSGAGGKPTGAAAASGAVSPFINSGICPPGWSCADIGGSSGSQTLGEDQWSVSGNGGDVWGQSDQFHFIWQRLAGNGRVSAQVVSQTNTNPWAKAGVMLRASTDPGAPYYFVFMTPGNGINVQYRLTQGGSAQQAVQLAGTVPAYLKLTRAGRTLTAYTSTDGLAWTSIAGSSQSIPALGGAALAGLALTSGVAGTTGTATFDTVSVGALTWNERVSALPVGLQWPATAVGPNGDVYVFGGLTSSGEVTSTYIYNPGSNGWSMGAALPYPVAAAQAVALPDGTIAVLGGETGCGVTLPCSGATVYTTVALYTPSSDSWSTTAIAALPTRRARFAAVLYQGQLYAIGGTDGSAALSSVDVYNLSTHKWSSGPALPQGLLGLAAVVDRRGDIDVMGGSDGVDPPPNYMYTSSGGAWSSGPNLPEYTQDAGATLGPDGQVYLVGGYSGGQYLPTTQVYNPVSNTWTLGAPPPAALLGLSVVTLPTGQLVALGGRGWDNITNNVSVYGPGVTLGPDGGPPGGATTLTGQGFTPGGAVSVTWGGAGRAPPRASL